MNAVLIRVMASSVARGSDGSCTDSGKKEEGLTNRKK